MHSKNIHSFISKMLLKDYSVVNAARRYRNVAGDSNAVTNVEFVLKKAEA